MFSQIVGRIRLEVVRQLGEVDPMRDHVVRLSRHQTLGRFLPSVQARVDVAKRPRVYLHTHSHEGRGRKTIYLPLRLHTSQQREGMGAERPQMRGRARLTAQGPTRRRHWAGRAGRAGAREPAVRARWCMQKSRAWRCPRDYGRIYRPSCVPFFCSVVQSIL